jgi:hypothetical protein
MIRGGCQYPLCGQPAVSGRGLSVRSQPVGVALCIEHLTVVDSRDWSPATHDFWRWFHAATRTLRQDS